MANKTKKINVPMTETMYDLVHKYSDKMNIKPTEFCRKAIANYCAFFQQKEKSFQNCVKKEEN